MCPSFLLETVSFAVASFVVVAGVALVALNILVSFAPAAASAFPVVAYFLPVVV